MCGFFVLKICLHQRKKKFCKAAYGIIRDAFRVIIRYNDTGFFFAVFFNVIYLTFDRYIAFVLTDFFEGLHYGHYPRQCQMCRRYFVMTSARQTMYCDGWATELWRWKRITCRNLSAQQKRKERAANDPITVRYNSRCSAIRVEESRGTITKVFAAASKALAKEHKQLADTDPEYAAAGVY